MSQIFNILFFFFNDTATTEIYTLSLHDALPISKKKMSMKNHSKTGESYVNRKLANVWGKKFKTTQGKRRIFRDLGIDRKSTRLNSSHANISYAVFCLKKKKKKA